MTPGRATEDTSELLVIYLFLNTSILGLSRETK